MKKRTFPQLVNVSVTKTFLKTPLLEIKVNWIDFWGAESFHYKKKQVACVLPSTHRRQIYWQGRQKEHEVLWTVPEVFPATKKCLQDHITPWWHKQCIQGQLAKLWLLNMLTHAFFNNYNPLINYIYRRLENTFSGYTETKLNITEDLFSTDQWIIRGTACGRLSVMGYCTSEVSRQTGLSRLIYDIVQQTGWRVTKQK